MIEDNSKVSSYNTEMYYEKLVSIIENFYKNKKGIKLGYPSIDYLKDKLTEKNQMNPSPFFSMNNALGETKFDLTKKEIELILKEYMEENNFELQDINYGDKINISYNYKENDNNIIFGDEAEVELDRNKEYNSKISYQQLRKIIVNYYKEKRNIDLNYASIDYLKDKLTEKNQMNPSPYFSMNNALGETKFDISVDEIKKILYNYANENNLIFLDVNFDDNVNITYKMSKIEKKFNYEDCMKSLGEKIEEKQQTSEKKLVVEEKTEETKIEEKIIENQNTEREPNYERASLAEKLGERSFKLKQVEYNLDESKKKKKSAGILAGIFAAGTIAAAHFSGFDPDAAIQAEIEAIKSWDSLKEYVSMITPSMMATITGLALSLTKFIKNNKKYKDTVVERENLIASDPANFLEDADNLARHR